MVYLKSEFVVYITSYAPSYAFLSLKHHREDWNREAKRDVDEAIGLLTNSAGPRPHQYVHTMSIIRIPE